MRWRFELTHAIAGTASMSEPEGFVSGVIGFIRHPELSGLIKEFKSGLRAYGSNGTEDGLRDWIKNVESVYGPDTIVTLKIYRAADNYVFALWYTGEIGIQTVVEGLELDHYLEFTPVQTSLWRAAMARFDTPVDIHSPLNLDGEAVTVYPDEVLNLPSQVIRYNGSYEKIYNSPPRSTSGGNIGILIDWEATILDEIKKFSIEEGVFTPDTNDINVIGIIDIPFDGYYEVTAKTVSSVFTGPAPGHWEDHSADFKLRARKVGSTFFVESTSSVETVGADSFATDVIIFKENLLKGDQVAVYGIAGASAGNRTFFGTLRLNWKTSAGLVSTSNITLFGEQTIDGVLTSGTNVLLPFQTNPAENGLYVSSAVAWTRHSDLDSASEFTNAAVQVNSGSTGSLTFWTQENIVIDLGVDPISWIQINDNSERTAPYSGTAVESYLRVIGDTTYKNTAAPAKLTHDVAASILDRITTFGKFYAPVLGSEFTRARVYDEAGTWWNNLNIKGVHLRGYSLAQKIFSMSMKDYWEGIKPLINPGMGYETVDGEEVITLRPLEEYYNPEMSVLLSGVQRIKRKYGPEYYNSVEVGFANGKTEDISGIDDPQKQTRASIFKNIGKPLKILCTWIAQGLTIEHARRTTKVKSADYKFDDNTFVIEGTKVGDEYTPRIDEDFTDTTGMLNANTRYNKHHTPAHIFLRHTNYLFAGLQKYVGSVYRFVSGEGNYDMTSTMVDGDLPDDNEGLPLAENGNIAVGTTVLWIPKIFEFEHYLTIEEFDIIDANRNKAIGISQTDANHQPFFIDELQMEIMTGQIKGTGKFKNEFDIVTVPQGGQIFQGGRIFDASFDITFE